MRSPQRRARTRFRQGSGHETYQFDNVLVAIDGSEGAQRALDCALSLIERLRGQLTALVVEGKLPAYAATAGEVEEVKREKDSYFRRVLEEARRQATERGIAIHVHHSPDEHVLADPQRLHQVLVNLLSNAVKYNGDGGQVSVTWTRRDGRVRISVQDTGPGIPASLVPRLFTPFERLGAEKSAIPGSGLGLALSKQLVERMGGTIGVVSEEGQGTTFWTELPATS